MKISTGRSGAVLKTYSILLFFLALKAAGNSAMAWGMKQVPERMSMNPALYLRAMLNPFVAMGIAALILALLTRMALLSLADLSFVLPVTAVGYVISVYLGKALLNETVTRQRWLGTLLIFAGAILVGSTSQHYSGRPEMKWVLVAAIVFATVLGDLLQSHEMKRAGEQSVSARGLARLLHVIAQRRLLILGIACNAVSFFSFMALVQTEPLSFAVPASSASFVLETLLAKFVLHERLGARRAAGALAVLAGVVLVGG